MTGVVLFAHQGGWDEILMVAGPVAIFASLLGVARKRALELADAEAADDRADTDQAGTEPEESPIDD